ncbi:NAD(P)-binding domain-containing protein, partial [Streptococcus pyogenes]
DALRKDGVAIASSAEDAVTGAQVVVSMLPASQHVEGLYLGSDGKAGLLEMLPTGTLVIDSSTIAAATSRKVAQAAAKRGVVVIDAPVS